MKAIFRGKVINGRPIMGSDYAKFLHTLEGCDIDVTTEKHREKRSINQNKYYWGVVIELLCHGEDGKGGTGYSTDEMHELVRGKFLAEEKKVGKDIIHYSRSTTSLKTNEFETLMTKIREWASAELEIFVPLPNEVEV